MLWICPLLFPLLGQTPVDFNRDVRPILVDKCYHCHGPDEENRNSNLRLDSAKGSSRAVRGKTPEDSELHLRISSTDPDIQMPPPDSNIKKKLSIGEIKILKAWLGQGAPYAKHWAYERPTKRPLPATADAQWSQPIDRFIADRLVKEGLSHGPRAPKELLLRRVTLDLTGLPPTVPELSAFMNDTSPQAYDRVVDRLLASPRYGERMALMWMDLGRYGDSSVFHADGPRDMWGWRDWVIRAFNSNMPYDRFTLEQIAGDLIPQATVDQKVASGFNRNHATTDEGGAIAEEYRVEYVVDRVKTVSSAWLAMSLECGQCHDHKYDPVTQKEYYRFFAYFNNTKDPGMQTRNGNQAPVVEIFDPEAETKRAVAAVEKDKSLKEITDARSKALASKELAEWITKQKLADGDKTFAAEALFYLGLGEKDRTEFLTPLVGPTGFAVEGKAKEVKRPGGEGIALAGNALFSFEDGPQLDWNQPFTFAFWTKVPKDGGGFLLTRMNSEKAHRGFDLGLDRMRPGLHLIHNWPDNGLKVYAKNPITPDAWHRIIIRHDGSGKAKGISLYVDGKLQENEVLNDNLRSTTISDAPLRLGGRSDAGRYRGDIDALGLWKGLIEPDAVPESPVTAILKTPVAKRTTAQKEILAEAYLRATDKAHANRYKALGLKLASMKKNEKAASSVMIMEDLPKDQMRKTFILNRGQYDQPKKDGLVEPGVPAILGSLPKDAPPNRLGLAQWMIRPEHPLTSRVMVNRLWQLFLGEGFVKTAEDFGLQGDMPSHPDLHDWLATDLVESGWNIKRMIKMIVTSETYCQDPRIPSAHREKDPENRLLGRGPRFRLQGEFLRDQALFVSNLYFEKIGGPSVRPYQPPNIWEDVALDTNLSKYVQDRGEKLFRRSMYTYWKRSSPHPVMTTFDAPSREKCTATRPRTNTPLQALVTLNEPQFVEAARAFAQRVLKEGGSSPAERIGFAYRTTLAREPKANEITLFSELLMRQKERFAADKKKATDLLSIGESPRDTTLDSVEHASWTILANTLFNLDEFLTRN